MEKKIILDSLKKQSSKSIKDVSVQFGDCIIRIEKKSFCDTMRFLREEPFRFNILLDLTCVDYYGQDERFEMVYHLFSLSNKFRLRLKVRLSEKDLSIESLTPFWENANWLEREVFDMFGVHFGGHPDLRRIFMYEGFEGYPLRKDYPLTKRQLRIPKEIEEETRLQKNARKESLLINMGPSHPAMHGTIRIMLELDGERILNSEVEVGYLHRGFEKTCENKSYFNLLPYTDRLNYVSPLINNLAYVMAVEKMLGIDVPEYAQFIRLIMSELSRICDHLTCIAAMAMECGAFTVFLYNIKAREFIWDVIERTTGARMTTSYIRIGGVKAGLHQDWKIDLERAVSETRKILKDVHGLLDKNKIFLNRTRDIAVVTPEMAINYGWTGPCLRSTGVYYDVRKAQPYLVYDQLEFEVPLGEQGDNYDRYMVRMKEIEQSLRIIEQAMEKIPEHPFVINNTAKGIEPAEAIMASRSKRVKERIQLSPNLEGSEKEQCPYIISRDKQYIPPPKEDTYTTIEGLIRHFKFFMRGHGIRPPEGEVYFPVEGGNGELGFYIVSDGTDRPYRLHLRAPCFHIVSALEQMIQDHYIADIIPTFGSLNMIGGELDR